VVKTRKVLGIFVTSAVSAEVNPHQYRYSVPDMSRILGISTYLVRKAIRDKTLPAVSVSAHSTYVLRADLVKYLESIYSGT